MMRHVTRRPAKPESLALLACVLWSGCFGEDFHPLDFEEQGIEGVPVCVQSDVGRCCQVLEEPQGVGCVDDSGACVPGPGVLGCGSRATCTAPFERTPSRCLFCAPWSLEDGGTREPFAPPPNPPFGAGQVAPGAGEDGDAGSDLVEVCGPATYLD
jgi:hypothetical protein